MSLYFVMLLVHSWTRWLVIGSAGVALATLAAGSVGKRALGPGDHRAMRVFLTLFDVQVTMGLILYLFLSPLGLPLWQNPRNTMKVSALRYFAVEHIFAMLVAALLGHIVWILAKRDTTPRGQRRRAVIAVVLPFLIVLASLPWPGSPYGRPLFRTLSQAAPALASPPAALTAAPAPLAPLDTTKGPLAPHARTLDSRRGT